jgi:hypothetical protein
MFHIVPYWGAQWSARIRKNTADTARRLNVPLTISVSRIALDLRWSTGDGRIRWRGQDLIRDSVGFLLKGIAGLAHG